MRRIESEDVMRIEVDDESSPNVYRVSIFNLGEWHRLTTIKFQDGPITEQGCNGITDKALMAVLLDHLSDAMSERILALLEEYVEFIPDAEREGEPAGLDRSKLWEVPSKRPTCGFKELETRN